MTRPMTSIKRLSRRRFIKIAASAGGAGLLAPGVQANSYRTFSWRGVALGAEATLSLHHHDEAEAKGAIAESLAEVARLESVFSLHRPDSAISRLNRDGRIDDAPADLRILLAEALALAERTQGAFDPTVQPLWALYARHFRDTDAAPDGPSQSEIEAALGLVGWRHVVLRGAGVELARPGMALTLNGIAQGYITDRVGDLLRQRGLTHVLVNMGEQLALGPRWDGSPWLVGIASPSDPRQSVEQLPLSSGAIATSSASGFAFDAQARHTHILDPRTGRPAASYASISVLADRATLADGLSTALMILPASGAREILGSSSAYAVTVHNSANLWIDGTSSRHGLSVKSWDRGRSVRG